MKGLINLKTSFIILLVTTSLSLSCGNAKFTSNYQPKSDEDVNVDDNGNPKKDADNKKQKKNNNGDEGNNSVDHHHNHDSERENLGLYGGHFDFDSFDENGDLIKHIHEFDNKFNVIGVDYRGGVNYGDSEKTKGIKMPSFGGENIKFVIINGDLSSARIKLNNADLKPGHVYNDSSIHRLRIEFDANVINNGKIHASNPGCVKKNTKLRNPGDRNGALTLRAISDKTNSMLWETSLYWHNPKFGGCK